MVGEWVGGWVAGLIENITNSAQLRLGLGLSLSKKHMYHGYFAFFNTKYLSVILLSIKHLIFRDPKIKVISGGIHKQELENWMLRTNQKPNVVVKEVLI